MAAIHLKIAKLRKLKGVSQKQLALALSVAFQTVSKWENGIAFPDITLLPDIAEFFSVSTDELLGIKPLKGIEYRENLSDYPTYWDHRSEYLSATRKHMWNEDYIQLPLSCHFYCIKLI